MQGAQTFGSMFRIALTVVLVATASGQAWAESVKSWALETHSGQVRLVKSGIAPIALTVGDVLGGGDWIETGPDGRAVLRRGDETIVVAPNSRIGLPAENTGPFATRILQTLGTILLTVEKRAEQHFEVVTPYLTAVVKGTTFTVGIQGTRASVHVVNGLVEVTNLASGRSSLIRPGQTGAVFSNDSDAGVRVEGGTTKSAGPVPNNAEVGGEAAANAAPGGPSQATIGRTLGPNSVNLAKSSNGLLRGGDRAQAEASFGAAGATGANGKAQAQGSRATPATAKGLALGQSSVASTGLGTGNGLALGQGNGNGLALGNGNGLALGQGNGLAQGNGNGLALGQSPVPNLIPPVNPGNGNGNGNSNGNGNGNGNSGS